MDTILNNKLRCGNFTSSEIHRLTGAGKFKTYVQEKTLRENLVYRLELNQMQSL